MESSDEIKIAYNRNNTDYLPEKGEAMVPVYESYTGAFTVLYTPEVGGSAGIVNQNNVLTLDDTYRNLINSIFIMENYNPVEL